jgi:hypothetical protein
MAVVDGRPSSRKHITHQDIAAMPDGPIKSLLLTAPPQHDYPACAIFRGGKCSCDEADSLCPQCGSEEWDRITDRSRVGPDSFNRCHRCGTEWEAE